MARPLLFPLFSLVCGLLLGGRYSVFLPQIGVALLLVVALLALFLANRVPFLVAISLTVFVAGNLSLKPLLTPSGTDIAMVAGDETIMVEGLIDARPEAHDQGCRLTLAVEHVFRSSKVTGVSGRLLVYVEKGRGRFMIGDRVRFASRVRRPRNYGLPGEFDYVRYLAWRGVHATAFVKDAGEIAVMSEGVAFPLQRRIDAIAADLGAFITRTVSPVEAGILRALLLGDMGGVDPALRDAYVRTGVNHILSISGFHVGIIGLFIVQMLLWSTGRWEGLLIRMNVRRFAPVVSLPILVFYLFLTGAAPATLRSVIMIATFIIALVIERDVDPLDSLILAALVILGLTPAALFDISFQLSFLALWGILVLTPLFIKPFSCLGDGPLKRFITIIMVSVAAMTVTLLPVAYYFHRASATGLIANLIVIPLMGYGAVITGFSSLMFVHTVPPLAAVLLHVAAFLVTLADAVMLRMARIPLLPTFTPSELLLALSYVFLAIISFVKPGKLRLIGSCILALLCIGTAIVPSLAADKKLKITFLSVGQGEASLITFPDGRHMLVDGGGSVRAGGQDVGERLLAPALWKLGVHRLDYVVLTHPHPDHLQGLRYIVANFPVGEFWESGFDYHAQEYLELKRLVTERCIPVRKVNAATSPVEIGGCRIEPLAPFTSENGATTGDFDGANEESVVFRLAHGTFTVLFTGDISSATEQRLIMSTPEKLHCTLLKVAHHGSSNSSSSPFLSATAPRFAVISAGFNNSFHLPTPRTLASLRQRGIRVYRTDFDGTIEVSSAGDSGNVVFTQLATAF